MKSVSTIFLSCWIWMAQAQENMHPSPPQQKTIAIIHAVVHVGNGTVIPDGSIVFRQGKIVSVGQLSAPSDAIIIDAKGQHVYPGIIAANTSLGLIEVAAEKAGSDLTEVGDMNTAVRSLVAYHAESKVINTLRSNGILLAHVVPRGGTISGSSSVVQLDAWNWEDAAYAAENGIHLNMPVLINLPSSNRRADQPDRLKLGLEKWASIRQFFTAAKAYHQEKVHVATNLKFESIKGLFDSSKILYVHCDLVKEMLLAMELAESLSCRMVIVGASESWQIADLLKQHHIGVVLADPHRLPATDDDDIDQPFKTAATLQQAGVVFTISIDMMGGFWAQRNLIYQAGSTVAYGLTKEEALQSITLNAARLLGIEQKTGTLEVGKDANVLICAGDILDTRSSVITRAFIQGRDIDLHNKQTQLFETYKYKYQLP